MISIILPTCLIEQNNQTMSINTQITHKPNQHCKLHISFSNNEN